VTFLEVDNGIMKKDIVIIARVAKAIIAIRYFFFFHNLDILDVILFIKYSLQ